RFASELVRAAGLGSLDGATLEKFLKGRPVSMMTYIGETDEGVTARASRAELQTMLQLVYLAFSQPRQDPAGLESLTRTDTTDLRTWGIEAIPSSAFSDRLQRILTADHMGSPTLDMIRRVNVDKAMAFYRDRFGDASNFTFVLVGSLDLPALQPVVERYLGAL